MKENLLRFLSIPILFLSLLAVVEGNDVLVEDDKDCVRRACEIHRAINNNGRVTIVVVKVEKADGSFCKVVTANPGAGGSRGNKPRKRKQIVGETEKEYRDYCEDHKKKVAEAEKNGTNRNSSISVGGRLKPNALLSS